MNILHIDSSILGEASASRELSREVVAQLVSSHPSATVRYRDLVADPLPHLSGATLSGTNPADAARDAEILEEFEAADAVVIGAPLYNFSVPSQLKAWIDRISIKGRTFRYTEKGPQGLAAGKRVVIVTARGGVYEVGGGAEFAESYLTFLFGFLGISDVAFVRAEGLNVSGEHRARALGEARASIARLPPPVPALAA